MINRFTGMITAQSSFARLALGGGCHWCTEGVFVSLRGVSSVDQGWIAAAPPNDAYSEAVVVHYDPTVVSEATLVEVHLRTHAATAAHPLRPKYRSALYAFYEAQAARLRAHLSRLQSDFPNPLITRVLPFAAFRPNTEHYQDYFRKRPDAPFCVRHVWPKLAELRRWGGEELIADTSE